MNNEQGKPNKEVKYFIIHHSLFIIRYSQR